VEPPARVPPGQPEDAADTLSQVSGPADDPLLPAVALGDTDAVGELWSRYAGRVRSLGLQLSGYDPSFGDDLVQETFARLWRSAERFDPARGTETTFVFTVARRAAVDLWRRSRRSARDRPLEETRRERSANPSDAGTGASLDGRTEAAARLASDDGTVDAMLTGWVVNEALATLGPAQREVIDLAYFGQLSQSEIAERLGIPLGTVKTRTFAALRALRAELASHGVLP
jgi:RNA polymerase sigma-70 factor (ECF subfamily)